MEKIYSFHVREHANSRDCFASFELLMDGPAGKELYTNASGNILQANVKHPIALGLQLMGKCQSFFKLVRNRWRESNPLLLKALKRRSC